MTVNFNPQNIKNMKAKLTIQDLNSTDKNLWMEVTKVACWKYEAPSTKTAIIESLINKGIRISKGKKSNIEDLSASDLNLWNEVTKRTCYQNNFPEVRTAVIRLLVSKGFQISKGKK